MPRPPGYPVVPLAFPLGTMLGLLATNAYLQYRVLLTLEAPAARGEAR